MPPIVVTVKLRPRYSVRCVPESGAPSAELFDRIAGYRKARRPHQSAYTLHDWVHLADYLNDRVASYPVPASLLYMRSEHNEDRRKAEHPKPINTGRLRASLATRRRRRKS